MKGTSHLVAGSWTRRSSRVGRSSGRTRHGGSSTSCCWCCRSYTSSGLTSSHASPIKPSWEERSEARSLQLSPVTFSFIWLTRSILLFHSLSRSFFPAELVYLLALSPAGKLSSSFIFRLLIETFHSLNSLACVVSLLSLCFFSSAAVSLLSWSFHLPLSILWYLDCV